MFFLLRQVKMKMLNENRDIYEQEKEKKPLKNRSNDGKEKKNDD